MTSAVEVSANWALPVSGEQEGESRQFSGSRYLFREAAKAYKVRLEEHEDNDWRALLGGAYLVDHLLDVEQIDIMPAINAIVAGELRDDLHTDTQARFANYMRRQPKDRYVDIMRRLGGVSAMAERQASATTAGEVIKVRLEEAELLAYLLSLPEDQRQDANGRRKFNKWLRGWSRAGYLLDSFIDMRDDYESGASGLEPTVKIRAQIGSTAAKEMARAAVKTPPQLLGKCALVGFRYLVLNKKPDLTYVAPNDN